MRHIKRAALDQVTLVVPGSELCKRFEEICQPMHDLIERLRDKNVNLRTTRDLLLPKLIAGEIDVSALSQEPIPEAAD